MNTTFIVNEPKKLKAELFYLEQGNTGPQNSRVASEHHSWTPKLPQVQGLKTIIKDNQELQRYVFFIHNIRTRITAISKICEH